MSKSDPQQENAYKWEDQFLHWPGSYLTPKGATTIAQTAAKLYKIPVPELKFARIDQIHGKTLPSSYYPGEHKILFRPRHMNTLVVLHEMAHAITDYILGNDLEAHGAEWLGVYMVLMQRFGIAPTVALVASAKAMKLKFRPYGVMQPKKIRKRYKKRTRLAREERKP